jgi:CheY-like chemotaxis protein
MPGGGTVTFTTENAEITEHTDMLWPGRYVQVRVADTGAGMSPEVMARAFEPFFTTKPKGEGTGLGLATVHGIVTEAAGLVRISSWPQRGTTFTILLPATDEPLYREKERTPVLRSKGAGETVLICEDEPAIREVARRILARNGYEVILADDGLHAIRLARTHPGALHLLLTDVVMPQVLGKDVAEAVRAQRGDVKVLFMSGYARPVLAGSGTLEAGVNLLEKPFSEEGLLAAVREVLDAG